MIISESIADELAFQLLRIGAVRFDLNNPFTWASGLKSPVYTDNRLTLSYTSIRKMIIEAFNGKINQLDYKPTAVAGVATAGIPHGVLLAESQNLPFFYVRNSPKEHGLGKQIEGRLEMEWQVLVVEDLVSTGKSSLNVVKAIRNAGSYVDYVFSVFDYGFSKTQEIFSHEGIKLFSVCSFNSVLKKTQELNLYNSETIRRLQNWHSNPENWEQIFD